MPAAGLLRGSGLAIPLCVGAVDVRLDLQMTHRPEEHATSPAALPTILTDTEPVADSEASGNVLQRARAAARWNGMSSLFGRLVTTGTVLVMARLVGPSPFGDFAIALALSAVVGQVVETGAGFALIHHPRLTERVVWAHVLIQLCAGVARVGLSLAVWPLLIVVFSPEIGGLVLALGVLQLVAAVGATARALLERDLRFRAIAVIDGLAVLCSSVAGLAAAAAGWGAWAILLGGAEPALVFTLVQVAAGLVLMPRSIAPRGWPLAEVRWFLAFGRGVWISAQVVPVTLHLDRLVVGWLFGPATVGVYDLAMRLVMVPVGLVQTLLARVMMPVYARIQKDDVRIGAMLRQQLLWVGYLLSLWFVVVCLADFAGFAEKGLGQGWVDAPRVAIALTIVGCLRGGLFVLWPALIATNQSGVIARYNIALAAALLVSVPSLAALFGVGGVAAALTVSTLIATLVLIRAVRSPWIRDRRHARTNSIWPIAGMLIGLISWALLPPESRWISGLTALLVTLWGLANNHVELRRFAPTGDGATIAVPRR